MGVQVLAGRAISFWTATAIAIRSAPDYFPATARSWIEILDRLGASSCAPPAGEMIGNDEGVEEVSGERKHAIAHYLDLAADGRVNLRPMLTHTFGLEQWRGAFLAIANQGESGAVKVAIDFR